MQQIGRLSQTRIVVDRACQDAGVDLDTGEGVEVVGQRETGSETTNGGASGRRDDGIAAPRIRGGIVRAGEEAVAIRINDGVDAVSPGGSYARAVGDAGKRPGSERAPHAATVKRTPHSFAAEDIIEKEDIIIPGAADAFNQRAARRSQDADRAKPRHAIIRRSPDPQVIATGAALRKSGEYAARVGNRASTILKHQSARTRQISPGGPL